MTVLERRHALRSGLTMAMRVHHAGAPVRIFAVHGWLDNAASFDTLAAHMPDCEIVAVDLIGHGRSDHRSRDGWYHAVDYLDELLELLDALDWQRSVWLGHSLGGGLLSMLAAACPDRVERLILIESGGLLGGSPERAAEQLQRGLADRRRFRSGNSLRVFVDADEATVARQKVNGLSESAARALVKRGLNPVEGGQVWSTDPRLTLASPLRIDEGHVQAMLRAIACPLLVLLAEPPLPFMSPLEREARLACLPGAEICSFPGNHHLHMETPAPLAEAIMSFLRKVPSA